MKTVAIITEYNPFHLGHLWQLKQVKERFGEDCRVIILMSGHFVQRGEPAIMSREARTTLALEAGASLVLEIPLAFATASARDFADGAVRLLSATGVCQDLICGAESAELAAELRPLAEVLLSEDEEYRGLLTEELAAGRSFAAAREQAILKLNPAKAELWGRFFRKPNNILALEYQLAIMRENTRRAAAGRKSKLRLQLLERVGDDRAQEVSTSEFASATAIRRILSETSSSAARLLALETLVPSYTLSALLSQPLVVFKTSTQTAIASLLARTPAELLPFRYFEEGLAARLLQAAETLGNLGSAAEADFWALARTRYYAQTRLQRAVLSWQLGLRQELWEQIQADGPAFIRVCGCDKHGRYLLRLMRKLATLPRIDKNSDLLEVPGTALASARAQQTLALTGERLYHLLQEEHSAPVFDTYAEIR